MAFDLSLLARVEIGLGLPDSAAEHARAVAEILDGSFENPMFSAIANRLLAVVALARGEATDAEALAHKSLATATEHDLVPHVFSALDILAETAAALESFEEAARILGAAERARIQIGRVRWAYEQTTVDALKERLADELGAQALAESVAQGEAMSTEEAIGWLRRARGTRKRPAGGWESLTPTELQVVQRAAEGLTNPEIGQQMFISRGTVKIHLSHIYAKLDVRNRAELTALVARRIRA
jgi:DNA-binding CsgD family transcriptional regulator